MFNFGKGAGASKALEKLADLGKGNYEYISKENVELQLDSRSQGKKEKVKCSEERIICANSPLIGIYTARHDFIKREKRFVTNSKPCRLVIEFD